MAVGIAIAEAFMRLRVDPSQIRKDVEKGMAGVSTVGRIGKNLTKAITLPLVGAGVAAAKLSVDFGGAMNHIQALVGVSQKQVKQWSGQILDLARTLPQSPKELADALYFITSSGIEGAHAMDVLKASAKAAASGLGDTATVADAVTSALNAYKGTGLSATDTTDILTQAVKDGKAEADAFAGSIGRVIPISSQLGVRFDEVAAAMASMTLAGLNADEAATATRGILNAILKPGAQAQKTAESLGISFDDIRKSLKERGLLATLQDLKARTGGNQEAMGKLFPRVRSLNGVLALTGKNSKTTEKVFNDLKNATGATDRAFQAASQTAGFKLKAAFSSLQATAIQLGDIIVPVIVKIVQWVARFADWLGKLSPGAQQAAVGIAAIAAAIGPVLIITAKLIQAFRDVRTVMNDLQVASKLGALLTNPWVLLAAAVAVAAYLIITHWNTVKGWLVAFWHWLYNTFAPAVKAVWNGLVVAAQAVAAGWRAVASFFVNLWNVVIGAFQRFMNWVTSNFNRWWASNGDAIKAIWSAVWQGILSVVTPVWNAISTGVRVGFSIMVAVFKLYISVLVAVWKGWWAVSQAVLSAAWSVISAVLKAAWGAVSAIFKAGVAIAVAVWKYMWTVIGQVLRVAWAAIQAVVKIGWDIVVGLFTFFINLLTGKWGKAWNALKTMLVQIWNAMKGFIGVVLSAIYTIIRAAWNLILSVSRAVWGGIKGFFTSWWNGLKNAFKAAVDGVANVLSKAWDGIKSVAKKAWEGIKNVVDAAWSGIKKVIRAPLVAAATVWNGFANGVNAVADVFHLPHVGKITVPGFRAGGKLPGYGGGDILPFAVKGGGMAMLEPGETIVSKESSRLPFMREAFAMAGVPGYALGGIIPGGFFGKIVKTAASVFSGGLSDFAPGAIAKGLSALSKIAFNLAGIGDGWFPNVVRAVLNALAGGIRGAVEKGVKHETDQFTATLTGPIQDSGARSHSAQLAQQYARGLMGGMFGWTSEVQWSALRNLWNGESGWNAYAVNASSGAYGIPQALGKGHPFALGDYKAQILWGLRYIKQRYGDPLHAWAFWLNQMPHWYHGGGGVEHFASGGRIPEPVLGIGPSGRSFSFGEGERVVPPGEDPLLRELKLLRRAVDDIAPRTAAGVARAVTSPRQTATQAARVGAR